MDWRPIVVLAHVLAAFWWFAGYAGTNLCTEIARRSTTDDDCRAALAISDRIDVLANRTGGMAVGLTGLLALLVFGYSLTLWPLIASGMAVRRALGLAFASDTISIAVMELVDNAVVLLIPGAMLAGLDSILFWVSLAVALAIAWIVAFPVNRWLIARGRGHAVIHGAH